MRLGLAAGLSTLLAIAPLAAQTLPPAVPLWTPVRDTVGSAPRIMNPGYTAWRDSTTGWTMTIDRSVVLTMPDGSGGRAVQVPTSQSEMTRTRWRTLLLADGRLLVSHDAPASIELYGADGVFVRVIGRSGPGDSSYVGALGMTMYHDTLVVHDGRQGAARLYTLDGRFVRGFPTGIRGAGPTPTIDPRGRLRVDESVQPAPMRPAPGDTTAEAIDRAMEENFRKHARWRWIYFSMQGLRVDSIEAPPPVYPRYFRAMIPAGDPSAPPGVTTRGMMTLAVPYLPKLSGTFLRDGTLLTGYTDRFEFVNTRTGRDTIRIFGRSNVPVLPVTQEHLDSLIDTQRRAGMPEALAQAIRRDQIPAAFPAWNDVVTDEKGYLWVSVGMWSRRNHYFAVFAPDGRYLGWVISRFESFESASWANDRVAVAMPDLSRRPVVRIYRIDRRGM